MRRHEFVVENGVHVWLKQKEREDIAEMFQVLRLIPPSDYIVCYPMPPINFMTNRPSQNTIPMSTTRTMFQNSSVTQWQKSKIRPAAILIDNRALNQTEESRFRNWRRTPTNGSRAITHTRHISAPEIYARPDLVMNGILDRRVAPPMMRKGIILPAARAASIH
jgi:hypothetical protein